MSPLTLRYHRGGVHLPKLGLWLDPHESQPGEERVFVSHAHADHIGKHREVILSAPTSKLMRARLSGQRLEHVLPFGQRASFDHQGVAFDLTLLPAGHILGSAMVLLEAGDSSLLYTGDFKLRPGLSAEACEPRRAEILVMETTFGRRPYRFPPAAEVLRGVIHFCREALDNDETPVLLGYSLGKSQELLCGLAGAGLPIMLHAQIHKLTEIYRELGHTFPAYEKFEAGAARGKVILCPPSVVQSATLRSAGPIRTAILTGWAVDANCRFRYHADAAFPLSDHADFPDLIEMVKRVQPKKVYTLHGFAADFARTLRELGYDAQALSEEEQLSLSLALDAPESDAGPPSDASVIRGPWSEPAAGEGAAQSLEARATEASGPPNSFHLFAETCRRIGSTAKKLEKVRLLRDYLRRLDPDSLAAVTTWFTGHPFPPVQNKTLQLGWAVIRDVLCAVGEMDQAEFGQVYLKHSDLGETTAEILLKATSLGSTLTIDAVARLFENLLAARGPLAKVPWLAQIVRLATALEGKFLVKILTGDLRIGLKEGLLEEAVAQAFGLPLEQVKSAHLLLGDVGETARLAQRRELASATLVPFRPIKYMLASPEETAESIWKRVQEWSAPSTSRAGFASSPSPEPDAEPAAASGSRGVPTTVWLEDKYDGIRCQLHKVGRRVALYSRDLKEITVAFAELVNAAHALESDFILDGEIVAMRGEQALPFGDLQRRLGRREGDFFLSMEIPVQFVAFDLLWFQGESYLDQPLRRRREKLEGLISLRHSRITQAGSVTEIERAFDAARQRGHEGLMIKDPASVYLPGRRGLAWLKLKKAFGTLDCVVIGAEYGQGKRQGVLSDYTFAIRDEASGALQTLGKAYIGLTDSEIAALTAHFLSKVTRREGRYLEVEPDTVLEIAFDAIQPSPRHTSGLALRFPRITRIRKDKSPAEIDTLAAARRFVRPESSARRG